jgi:hypothetical protein
MLNSDEFMERVKVGIMRNSTMLLDNIGIHVNLSTLPSTALRNAAYQRAYGYSKITRLFSKLRARVLPRRQAELEKTYERYARAVELEFMQAAMAQAAALLEAL